MDEEKNQGVRAEVLSEQLEEWSCYRGEYARKTGGQGRPGALSIKDFYLTAGYCCKGII